MTDAPSWTRDYIGKREQYGPPYGCFLLVRDVLVAHFGLKDQDIPDFSNGIVDDSYRARAIRIFNGLEENTIEVVKSAFAPGDIALIYTGGLPAHVGVVVSPACILHTDEEAGVCIERVNSPRLSGKLRSFHRPNALQRRI